MQQALGHVRKTLMAIRSFKGKLHLQDDSGISIIIDENHQPSSINIRICIFGPYDELKKLDGKIFAVLNLNKDRTLKARLKLEHGKLLPFLLTQFKLPSKTYLQIPYFWLTIEKI